jgi:hypothetical protein
VRVKPWTNPPPAITASWISPDAATNPNASVAGGGALGGDEDVGPDAPVVEARTSVRPPEAGHHLVGDQQDPVARHTSAIRGR